MIGFFTYIMINDCLTFKQRKFLFAPYKTLHTVILSSRAIKLAHHPASNQRPSLLSPSDDMQQWGKLVQWSSSDIRSSDIAFNHEQLKSSLILDALSLVISNINQQSRNPYTSIPDKQRFPTFPSSLYFQDDIHPPKCKTKQWVCFYLSLNLDKPMSPFFFFHNTVKW